MALYALWLVAALATAGAALGWLAWRGEGARRAALEAEAEELRARVDLVGAEAGARTRRAEEREAELQELRRKLDKAKRRAFAAQEERAPREARVAEVEGELETRDREIRRLRDEGLRLAGELERSAREVQRLREELAKAPPREAGADPEALAALDARAGRAEEAARSLEARLREVEHEASRYRQRERTHRRLYMVIKGELDAAKDRIRALQNQA